MIVFLFFFRIVVVVAGCLSLYDPRLFDSPSGHHFVTQFKNIGCDDGVLRKQSLFVRDDTVGCHVVGKWERW